MKFSMSNGTTRNIHWGLQIFISIAVTVISGLGIGTYNKLNAISEFKATQEEVNKNFRLELTDLKSDVKSIQHEVSKIQMR